MSDINIDAIREAEAAKLTKDGILEALAKFGNGSPGLDQVISRHDTPPNKISIPTKMSLAKAAVITAEAAKADAEEKDFNKTFRYRPWDGAAALVRVLQKYFGTSGRGVAQYSFFGKQPPQEIEIEIAYGETINVPWGAIAFEPLDATLNLGSIHDRDYGMLFHMSVTAPKKHAASVTGLFNLIEKELKEHSIYKGQAIRGTDEPKFLPLDVDDSIVYNKEVYDSLDQSVWGVIRNADALRHPRPAIKTDPKVLLHGPYGTGKSEAGRLTAKVAVDNGWTFISHESGKASLSDLERVLQTARLLAPAVVFIEDVDLYASNDDPNVQSRMLEMFDGISSKGHEVMVLMTSNRPATFSKGMLRAGRINKMIEIGPLNREAMEELIRRTNKDTLGAVDFDRVYEAMEGFEPAFVRQVFDDARQAAVIRTADELKAAGTYTPAAAQKFLLTTEDFITAANVMRPQHDKHAEAAESEKTPSLEKALGSFLTTHLVERIRTNNDEIGESVFQSVED